MRKFLKAVVTMGAAILAFSPLAGSTAQFASAQEEQTLTLSVGSEPPSIDPALATDTTSGAIINNVFEGLTTRDPEGNPEPGMAESWEVSEDGLTYTFTLRDATWSNGDPVTANDFEYAWKRVLDPATGAQYASIMFVVEGAEAYNSGEGDVDSVGVTAIDEKTLEVKLALPSPYFEELIMHYTFMPVHQATAEGNGDWALDAGESYITNGPFALESWNHSSDYTLVASDSYWDAEAVNLDEVYVQIIESEATANSEWQAGTLDYLGAPYGTISLDAIDLYRQDESLQTVPYAGIYWYKYNTTDEVVSNENIRKALGTAIDRQSLIDNVLKGEQGVALGYVPPTIAGFEEDRGYFADADFEAAQEYLAAGLEELGLSDASELEVEISINTSEAHSTIAQFIQEGWRTNLGINATIRNAEWQVYLEEMNNLQHQIGRMGWIADYNDANTFLDQFRTADSGNNDTGWENEEFKNLIDQAAAEQDPATRTQILLDAEAVMMEAFPVIPIYYYTNNFVVKDNVEGMQPDGLGNITLKHVSVTAE